MTFGGIEPLRLVRRFRRVVADLSSHRWFVPFAVTGSCLLRLPGLRPRAPKRNVVLGLIYLYALLILVSIGSV